jgi:hypothetical protein
LFDVAYYSVPLNSDTNLIASGFAINLDAYANMNTMQMHSQNW